MKNRTHPILITIILLSTILLSCNKSRDDKDEQNTMTSGYIKIAVDQTLQSVIQNEIDVFETTYIGAEIDPIYTTETEAIELLKKDSVRLAITARKFSQAELDYFHNKTFQPEAIRIAIDAIAIITNRENNDSIISLKNIKDILTGQVTKWNQVFKNSNQKDKNIQVVFDNTHSSIVRYAIDSICKDKPMSNKLNALELNEEVVNYVSKVPNAMGIIGVNVISDKKDTTVVDFTKKIQTMHVSYDDIADNYNSRQPYQYYLYTGDYPLRRDIYILLNDPRGELPKGFTRFVSDQIGQRIIKKSGLLPSVMPINAVKVIK